MEISEEQYLRIADCLPRQRGNVNMTNLKLLNALLYVAENGCKWRGLPKYFGNWHTIYTRMNRWSKAGVLDRIFARLQQKQILIIKFEAVSLDSTTIKVHPDGTVALKKRIASHRPFTRGLHHQDSSGCRACSVRSELLDVPGQAGDAPAGRDLLRAGGPAPGGCHLLMDRAYEGDETRDLAAQLGYIVVVPANPNRLVPWEYDRVCIADAMKLNGCFAASKASATCFPTSTNSMSCLPPLSSLR